MKIIYIDNKDSFEKEINNNQHNNSLFFISSPYSIYYLGLGYIKEMLLYIKKLYPSLGINFILDCHDDEGMAYAALTKGFKKIMIEKEASISLASIVSKHDAKIYNKLEDINVNLNQDFKANLALDTELG